MNIPDDLRDSGRQCELAERAIGAHTKLGCGHVQMCIKPPQALVCPPSSRSGFFSRALSAQLSTHGRWRWPWSHSEETPGDTWALLPRILAPGYLGRIRQPSRCNVSCPHAVVVTPHSFTTRTTSVRSPSCIRNAYAPAGTSFKLSTAVVPSTDHSRTTAQASFFGCTRWVGNVVHTLFSNTGLH